MVYLSLNVSRRHSGSKTSSAFPKLTQNRQIQDPVPYLQMKLWTWCKTESLTNLVTFLLLHIWTWDSSPSLLWACGRLGGVSFLPGHFVRVNYSERILLAPRSPCRVSQVTNTCLNHIQSTGFYATCNNTFNYDWLEFKFWFLLEHNQSWMGNFYSDN